MANHLPGNLCLQVLFVIKLPNLYPVHSTPFGKNLSRLLWVTSRSFWRCYKVQMWGAIPNVTSVSIGLTYFLKQRAFTTRGAFTWLLFYFSHARGHIRAQDYQLLPDSHSTSPDEAGTHLRAAQGAQPQPLQRPCQVGDVAAQPWSPKASPPSPHTSRQQLGPLLSAPWQRHQAAGKLPRQDTVRSCHTCATSGRHTGLLAALGTLSALPSRLRVSPGVRSAAWWRFRLSNTRLGGGGAPGKPGARGFRFHKKRNKQPLLFQVTASQVPCLD